MKTSQPATHEQEGVESFAVAVLYEDTVAHLRAREVCDRILDRFWGELEFEVNWWSFASLSHDHAAEHAARFAARANLILFAAHAGPELPAHVRRWFESWTDGRRANPQVHGALAALVGWPQEHDAVPIITYLQHIARNANMEFLPNAASHEELHPLTPTDPVTHDLGLLLDPRRPPPHWGINE